MSASSHPPQHVRLHPLQQDALGEAQRTQAAFGEKAEEANKALARFHRAVYKALIGGVDARVLSATLDVPVEAVFAMRDEVVRERRIG
jgi:hypothetical protein